MEKQKKNDSGITLVALVVSIIVMLVLAGVSLNMTVGDNGIIKQAQNASILQSCAILSEFLNQTYINMEASEYTTYNSDGTEQTPLEKMISSTKYSDWFYRNASKDYVLYDYTDSDGNRSLLKIRLINKHNMLNDSKCKAIAEQLVGGDAEGNSAQAYNLFHDVYGVTSDLQVFYCDNCEDGFDSAQGANFANASLLDGTAVAYNSSSSSAQPIARALGISGRDITNNDLLSVSDITISKDDNLSNLNLLYNLPNLTRLILINYQGSLEGLESAYKLTYIYFRNSSGVQNISEAKSLSKISSLKELYFYNPNNTEVKKIADGLAESTASITKLAFWGGSDRSSPNFGSGNDLVGSSFGGYDGSKSTFSNLSLITSMSSSIKSSATYMVLFNNSFESLSGIEKFTNLQTLAASNNKISDISKIGSLTQLRTLYLGSNQITSLSGSGNSYLKSNTNLATLYIANNPSLTSLEEVVDGISLSYLSAVSVGDLDFTTNYWQKNEKENILKLGAITNLFLDNKYALLFTNNSKMRITSTVTDAEFRSLINNEYISSLDISGNTNIKDKSIQDVIKSLSNLKYLKASGTNLSSLSCLTETSATKKILGQLLYLDIRNTPITTIAPLEGATSLCGLRCGTSSGTEPLVIYSQTDSTIGTKSSNIIKMICAHNSHLEKVTGFGDGRESIGGFYPGSTSLCSQLEKLKNLTTYFCYDSLGTVATSLDLSKTGLKTFNGTKDLASTVIIPSDYTSVFFDDMYCNVIIKNVATTVSTTPVIFNISSDWGNENISFDMTVTGVGVQDYLINYTQGIITSNPGTISDILNSHLKTISVGWYQNIHWNLDCNRLTSCTNLETLTIYGGKPTNLDKLSTLPKLQNIRFDNSNLNEFCDLSTLSKLVSLYIPNNNFSTVDFLTRNYNSINVSTLDLNNNYITNYIDYTDENNVKHTGELTSTVIGRLPKLRNLYISSKGDLSNYLGLTENGFSQSGTTFTRTLN